MKEERKDFEEKVRILVGSRYDYKALIVRSIFRLVTFKKYWDAIFKKIYLLLHLKALSLT